MTDILSPCHATTLTQPHVSIREKQWYKTMGKNHWGWKPACLLGFRMSALGKCRKFDQKFHFSKIFNRANPCYTTISEKYHGEKPYFFTKNRCNSIVVRLKACITN